MCATSGFFVDVPGLAMSGLVHLSDLADDFYVFDTQRNHLIGRRTRRVIKLGDKVEVQVAKVDHSRSRWISTWQPTTPKRCVR